MSVDLAITITPTRSGGYLVRSGTFGRWRHYEPTMEAAQRYADLVRFYRAATGSTGFPRTGKDGSILTYSLAQANAIGGTGTATTAPNGETVRYALMPRNVPATSSSSSTSLPLLPLAALAALLLLRRRA